MLDPGKMSVLDAGYASFRTQLLFSGVQLNILMRLSVIESHVKEQIRVLTQLLSAMELNADVRNMFRVLI